MLSLKSNLKEFFLFTNPILLNVLFLVYFWEREIPNRLTSQRASVFKQTEGNLPLTSK